MAATQTPNYGWTQPAVGGDASVWGTEINNDLALIDAQVYANEQATVMVGCITMYGGATPPANWLLCNGASLATTGTYAALFAIIGYAFGGSGANFNLPNLQARFPMGAGTIGATGGASTVTLATANLPAHNHPVTDPQHTHGASQPAHVHPDPGHTHGGSATQNAHSHNLGGNVVNQGGSGLTAGGSIFSLAGTTTDSQQPGINLSINAAATGLQASQPAVTVNAAATGVTTQNTGSGAAVNILPPFQAVNFIIRFA